MSTDRPNITIDEAVNAGDGMHQVRAVGADVFWLANIAAENFRGTVKRWRDGQITDLTPQASVRTRVNEYGGGCYDVDQDGLVFADDLTNAIYYLPHGSAIRTLVRGGDRFRYAGLRLATDSGLVLAVREQHCGCGEPRTEIVALSLLNPNDDGGQVLASGADFYGRPAYRAGELAWAQWNHPNMPWDEAEIWRSPIAGPARKVAGGQGVSAINPLFLADSRLAWLSDATGFWNVTLDDGTTITDPGDYCAPPWTLEEPPYSQLDDTTLMATRYANGRGTLVRVDLATATVEDLGLGMAEVESVACAAGRTHLVSLWSDRHPMLASLDSGQLVALQEESAICNSLPEEVWFAGPAGQTQAFFYPAAHPSGTPQPVIVRCHGGPTGMSRPIFDLETQFWTERGVALLDVNYSGSGGFGRAYRERLKGNWGVLEVADCEAAVAALVKNGRIDPARVAIMGGSAGGFTTLQALVTSTRFTAGISIYGVADLESLVRDTHKFESRYLDGLVGPYPQDRQTYLDRSPVHHTDRLSVPMLILQGRDDAVVPLTQAENMAEAVRNKGLPVALVVFDGEGHGFRMVENRKASLAARLSFLTQVWGLTPKDDLPPLQIENFAGVKPD